MIDEHHLDLINRGIDGELDADGQVELEQLLEDSEEARQNNAELQQLDQLLLTLPQQELPPQLHRQIFSSISAPVRPPRRFVPWPKYTGYGLAAAASMLLAIMIYNNQPYDSLNADPTSMVGTIARDNGEDFLALDTHTVDQPGLHSTVTLRQHGNVIEIDLAMDSDEFVELTIDLGTTGKFADVQPATNNSIQFFEFSERVINIRGRGRQRLRAVLRRNDRAATYKDTEVKLVYLRKGATGIQATLEHNLSSGRYLNQESEQEQNDD